MMRSRIETKVFDPKDSPFGTEVLDASVVYRRDQWWMYLAGQAGGYGATQLFSAYLAAGSMLSASGWLLAQDEAGGATPLCGHQESFAWDGGGGRHCPSYVKGWDPDKGEWVERLYYAGAAENLWGPYTIGFLEWDGNSWKDQPLPALVANEEWEHGSVYEPNLIYHEGTWKMWYVAGSNQEDYLVHGYAESRDGKSGWSKHTVFAAPELKLFDFCVRERGGAFEAVFARVSVGTGPVPPECGLWWCCADRPFSTLSEWSSAIQIMDAQDRGWHSGPWKPSLHYSECMADRMFVFFDGLYRTGEPGPFPFAFTVGCLEVDSPRCS